MEFLANLKHLPNTTELEEQVSRVVEEFAQEKKLEYALRHNDESVWLLWQDEETLTRRVRVGTFFERGKGPVFFIPQAYNLKQDGSKPSAKTVAPLTIILTKQSTEKSAKQIEVYLRKAWDRACAIHEDDLITLIF